MLLKLIVKRHNLIRLHDKWDHHKRNRLILAYIAKTTMCFLQ